jgi:tetratricopeptide (TPR) repeat protein
MPAILKLWDGTQLRRPSQGLAHLRALTERYPARGEAWRRLGNLLETFEKFAEAEAAWKEAIARDPNEAEACFSLAMLLDNRGDSAGAFGYVEELVARQSRQPGAWPLRGQMVAKAIKAAERHARRQGRPLGLRLSAKGRTQTIDLHAVDDMSRLAPLFERGHGPQAALTEDVEPGAIAALPPAPSEDLPPVARASDAAPARSGPKVGRNDPCPCGSGKKYKKCHGA